MSQAAHASVEEDDDQVPIYTYRDLENTLGITHSTAQRLLRKLEIRPTKIGLSVYLTEDEFRRAVRTYGTPGYRVHAGKATEIVAAAPASNRRTKH